MIASNQLPQATISSGDGVAQTRRGSGPPPYNRPMIATRAEILANAAAIRPYLRRTPLLRIDGADVGRPGIEVVLKLEYLQHAGSFKSRGAITHLLARPIAPAGVVAASGGNHGVAVAAAAQRLGRRATIFVPGISAPAKQAAIRATGAELQLVGERYADALAASIAFAERTGATPIHAYDDPWTLLGQASVAVEFEEDAPDLDALLVAVGGGGLLGGIAAWYGDRVALVGIEPETAPTLTHALAAGEPVDAPAGGIAADSLAPRRVGSLMFPLAQRHLRATALVGDDAIVAAQRMLWERLRIVVEPGGAAAFAALADGVWQAAPGSTVGVLLCGANTDAVRFAG
ncbi:MAG: threonine/serine dehydratase [Lautropia sp.]